jgi:uracil-DNA glycosylase family 4
MKASPAADCRLCPRLCDFRARNKSAFPEKHNAPVPSFGNLDASLLVVGLAPGLKGANFTGRPFTGDYAGDLLYATLLKFGFAKGRYEERADDSLSLIDCRITNAVRCVPPENKPTPEEMRTCLPFLAQEIAAMPNLRVILTLGQISHTSTLRALGEKPGGYKFGHGVLHHVSGNPAIINSYHCSRYNTQTRRLTEESFHAVFDQVKELLAA